MVSMSIGYYGHDSVHENLAETFSPSLAQSPLSSINPMREEDIFEEVECETFHFGALHQHGIILAFGLSVGIHATVVLLLLLTSIFFRPSYAARAPFITINMVDASGFSATSGAAGRGREDLGDGSGNHSPRVPLHPDTSPVSEGNPGQDIVNPVGVNDKMEPSRPIEQDRRTIAVPKPSAPKSKTKPVRARKPAIENSRGERVDESVSTTSSPVTTSDTPLLSDASGTSEDSGYTKGSEEPITGGGEVGCRRGPASGEPGRRAALSGVYDAKQVDIPPTPVRKVEPEFPRTAQRMGITGRVVLRFLVNTDGRVGKALVIEAIPGGFFEECALEAINKWRFHPGRYRGNAVATWVELPIQFRLYR